MTHIMKIDSEYLTLIKNGEKKHEYRLNCDASQSICVEDNIIFVSSINEDDYIVTSVKTKHIYYSWYEALKNNWKEDFKNKFLSLEGTISFCERYYNKEEISNKGLLVFEIELSKSTFNEKKVLISEDIVNQKLTYTHPSDDVISLYYWLNFFKCEKSVCFKNSGKNNIPLNVLEKAINHIKNDDSYKIFYKENVNDVFFIELLEQRLSGKYEILEFDKWILYLVYSGQVDYYITYDETLVRIAKQLYLKDRVLTVEELLVRCESKYTRNINYNVLSVKLKTIGELNPDDPFFDSLKQMYDKIRFTKWLKKKAKEKAYVFHDEHSSLRGFLYLKVETIDENYSDIQPIFSKKKRLKVGTFKTDIKGFRLGERYIKIIMDNAVRQKVQEIYVTLFEHKNNEIDRLKNLLCEWGFKKHGKKENGESVFVKTLEEYFQDKDPKYNFPVIKTNPNYYFLPIKPEFHTDLFPDNILSSENERTFGGNIPHRYSLEKIYLSGVEFFKDGMPREGDLVIIYRTKDNYYAKYSSVATGVAIIQKICIPSSLDNYIKECSNKTIFTKKQLVNFYTNKKYTTVIKLLHYKSFDRKIILRELYEMGIFHQGKGPRPFKKITKQQYTQILKKSRL